MISFKLSNNTKNFISDIESMSAYLGYRGIDKITTGEILAGHFKNSSIDAITSKLKKENENFDSLLAEIEANESLKEEFDRQLSMVANRSFSHIGKLIVFSLLSLLLIIFPGCLAYSWSSSIGYLQIGLIVFLSLLHTSTLHLPLSSSFRSSIKELLGESESALKASVISLTLILTILIGGYAYHIEDLNSYHAGFISLVALVGSIINSGFIRYIKHYLFDDKKSDIGSEKIRVSRFKIATIHWRCLGLGISQVKLRKRLSLSDQTIYRLEKDLKEAETKHEKAWVGYWMQGKLFHDQLRKSDTDTDTDKINRSMNEQLNFRLKSNQEILDKVCGIAN